MQKLNRIGKLQPFQPCKRIYYLSFGAQRLLLLTGYWHRIMKPGSHSLFCDLSIVGKALGVSFQACFPPRYTILVNPSPQILRFRPIFPHNVRGTFDSRPASRSWDHGKSFLVAAEPIAWTYFRNLLAVPHFGDAIWSMSCKCIVYYYLSAHGEVDEETMYALLEATIIPHHKTCSPQILRISATGM